jgi:GxxExxY protein
MTLIDAEPFSRHVIGCAIEVHRTLGPGLLESIYEACLCLELEQEGLAFQRQPSLPVVYKGRPLDVHFRPDLIIEQRLVVEVKAVPAIIPVHEAQLLTYMKIAGVSAGLLLNFNEVRLVDGIRRRLL